MKIINSAYYDFFVGKARRNEKLAEVPTKAEIEAAGCDVSGMGYLISPDGNQYNVAMINPEVLPQKLQDLFNGKGQEVEKKKKYTNEDAAQILGIDPSEVSEIRALTGLAMRGPLNENAITVMKDYLGKVKRACTTHEEEENTHSEDEEQEQPSPDIEPIIQEMEQRMPILDDEEEPFDHSPHIDEIEDPTTMEDNELVTISIGQLRELIRMVKGKSPRIITANEVLDAIGTSA